MEVDVPELDRQRALANGSAGRLWLEGLPDVVARLAQRWGLELGEAFSSGTAAYVVEALDARETACVLKVAMPMDLDELAGFERSVVVHQLADDRGCARLLDHDADAAAVPASAEDPSSVCRRCEPDESGRVPAAWPRLVVTGGDRGTGRDWTTRPCATRPPL
jgi:streptomycin 6-kinase